jgi:leucyl-tRNA synthetase
VINPSTVSEKYGIDTARFFLLSLAAPDKPRDWSEKGIKGSLKFTRRIYSEVIDLKASPKSSKIVESKINKAIQEISQDIEEFKFNLAVIKIRNLFNLITKEDICKKDIEIFLKLLSPFCPHLAEELWSKIGNKTLISLEDWPKADAKKIDEKLEKQEEQIGNLVSDINNILKILESKNKKPKSIKVYAIPNELALYKKAHSKIQDNFGIQVEVLSVKEAKEKGKTIKAKPGKPGIYIE